MRVRNAKEKHDRQRRLDLGRSASPVELLFRFSGGFFRDNRLLFRCAGASAFILLLPHQFFLSGKASLTPCGLMLSMANPPRFLESTSKQQIRAVLLLTKVPKMAF